MEAYCKAVHRAGASSSGYLLLQKCKQAAVCAALFACQNLHCCMNSCRPSIMTRVTLMPSGTKLCYMTQLVNPERQVIQFGTNMTCLCSASKTVVQKPVQLVIYTAVLHPGYAGMYNICSLQLLLLHQCWHNTLTLIPPSDLLPACSSGLEGREADCPCAARRCRNCQTTSQVASPLGQCCRSQGHAADPSTQLPNCSGFGAGQHSG